ncbi:MAG TPA: exodeoxyribonuclease VII large subunit [Bryobacteraceae bacterium]|nr:exodeoxyribonuclease VII large subunit [Bryobacteraceae bacterium]
MEQIALDWQPLRRTYTVSELTAEMRGVLTEHFTDIWVSGEISGTKVPPSGHYYFTLKDESAQIRAVCYKMTARYLKFKPQDGIAVVARGRIDVYDARGEVQFMVDSLEPLGHGALQLAFEQLKKRLAAEGLFEASRKRAIPALPERIGIVTSPSGAVIRDILQILERRAPGRHIRVYPSLVQGDGAAEQIAAGIEYFSESGWAEVVIVARGGGSLEDLWAFNEERVAHAIAGCSVPVISAVGHETDFTIADFVADLRAPTPSAAAELVIATRQSLIEQLDAGDSRLIQSVRLKLALSARRLHGVEVDPGRLHRAIGRRMQRVDEMEFRLRETVRAVVDLRRRALESVSARLRQRDVRLRLAEERRRLEEARRKLEMLEQRGTQTMRLRLSRAAGMLAPLEAHLKQLSPVKILERGYAIVAHQGRIVKSPADAPVGSDVRVRLAEGELGARVTEH